MVYDAKEVERYLIKLKDDEIPEQVAIDRAAEKYDVRREDIEAVALLVFPFLKVGPRKRGERNENTTNF